MAWNVHLQWTVDPPQDFQTIQAGDWPTLPRKPEPGALVVIDDQPGWVARLNVQGIDFRADHYHVAESGENLVVTLWNDGGGGEHPWADVWTLEPTFGTVVHALSNNQQLTCVGPIQHRAVYLRNGDGARHAVFDEHWTSGSRCTVNSWNAFFKPPASEVIHGVTVPEPLWVLILGFPVGDYTLWGP